jgi:hypothetical protein
MTATAVYRATPASVKVGAGVAGLAVAGLVLWVLWDTLTAARTVASEAGRAASNAATGLANATSGLPTLGSGIGTVERVVGGLLGADASSSSGEPWVRDYKPGQPTLELVIEDHGNWRDWTHHHTWATGYVIDASTRQRVPADVRIRYDNTLLRNAKGTEHYAYSGRGVFDIDNTTPNFTAGLTALGGTGFDLWAEAPGYNSSPSQHVPGEYL